jgi:hypothetical protein
LFWKCLKTDQIENTRLNCEFPRLIYLFPRLIWILMVWNSYFLTRQNFGKNFWNFKIEISNR